MVPWPISSRCSSVVIFAAVMFGLDPGARTRMTAVQGALLALSIVVFIYLGFAMFRAERF